MININKLFENTEKELLDKYNDGKTIVISADKTKYDGIRFTRTEDDVIISRICDYIIVSKNIIMLMTNKNKVIDSIISKNDGSFEEVIKLSYSNNDEDMYKEIICDIDIMCDVSNLCV